MVYITRISNQFGDWEIRATDRGICSVSNRISCVCAPENELSGQAARELTQYFAGERRTFSVPLDLSGTLFQRQVWKILTELPYGTSVSYSYVAQRLGKPAAVRAAAGAIGRNPCLIFIPCHRVLGKDGSLTGFSAGLEVKKALLELEGIPYQERNRYI